MLIKNYLPVQNCLFNALRIPSNNNTEPIFQVCTQDYHCKNDEDCVTGKCNYDGKCDCDEECKTGSQCTSDLECGTLGGVPIGSCNAYSKGCLCPPPPVSFGLCAQTPQTPFISYLSPKIYQFHHYLSPKIYHFYHFKM